MQKNDYIDNETFSREVMAYVVTSKQKRELGLAIPIIPDYIGRGFIKIANGMSRRPNFSRYSYKDDMIGDAIEACVKAIHNYNIDIPTKSGHPNAFAYFSQVAFWAFVRRLVIENKRYNEYKKYILSYIDENHEYMAELKENTDIYMKMKEDLRSMKIFIDTEEVESLLESNDANKTNNSGKRDTLPHSNKILSKRKKRTNSSINETSSSSSITTANTTLQGNFDESRNFE
jgi:hypothetical protein